MIEFSLRYSIILWMVIVATCYAFKGQCPQQYACTCLSSPNGDYEIHCPTDENSAFIIDVQQHVFIKTQCRNSPQWTDFHVNGLTSTDDIESIYFRMCTLPTNLSLGEIARRFGVRSVKTLVFESFEQLGPAINRTHLQELPDLQHLTLSSNGLTNLSSDLFADIPQLVWLDLRENRVHLSPGIFKYTPNLEVLELGMNMMGNIEPSILNPLEKLRFLNLWQNKFTEIKPGTFDKLETLNSLDLNGNELTTLPKDIFAKLKNLEALNLFSNNFSSLPEGLLEHNVRLREVNLYANKRNMTTLPNRLFANLKELVTVELRSNGLKKVPADLFRGSFSLNNISLQRNFIESLPKDLFNGLEHLSKLLLNYNELTSLPDEIFLHLKHLVTLDLSKNHLTSISRSIFKSLKSLEYLNMSENKLKVIEDTSFYSLTKLRIAQFSHNYLKFNASINTYPDDFGNKSVFHTCTALQELHLARNNISEIYSDWTIGSLKLRILDLRYNQITQISAENLQFLSNDIKVNLTHNRIKYIYLSTAERLAKFQTNPRNVIIYVENNPIVCDCDLYDFLRYMDGRMHPYVQNFFHIIPGHLKCQSPDWLADIEIVNLKSKKLKCQVSDPCPDECKCWLKRDSKAFLIDCSHQNLTRVPHLTNITTLPSEVFQKLELNLTGNKLTRMSPVAKIGSSNMQISKLLLSNNNIDDISVDELPLNIEVLELHNNNISRLNSDVLQFMNNTSLMTVTLDGNPWICDCDTRDFLNFIQTKVIEIPNSLKITCRDMNVPMLKMTATDLCSTNIIIIIVISVVTAITGLIIGVLAALYYRYQREIKVWLYAHQLCLWLVTEDELDKDKLYDAFISYSHKDEDFIVNELVPQLESGPRPFKLCLHFRDWLAGEWIPTQIARSVQDSRRTVVVLSPNFLESVWGRMEFRAAHSQALSEGRARVILILYGEIGPTDDLDPELKAYLSMNTYVKWGDPWFWDKLRYALPHALPHKLSREVPNPSQLAKYRVCRRFFANPCIQINGEKKDLIYPNGVPETPPAASTPPADSLKAFICDEKNSKEHFENLSPTNNAKLILLPEDLIKHNLLNKVQCTTV
ncbi:protein toll [Bombus bifarius]|uniref:Protein toll n=1 Tax=Bombus bifarius TaxID=103933 RepID=A0A6P8LFL2_9HYME|nr:protein toll [Bombus bifarius]